MSQFQIMQVYVYIYLKTNLRFKSVICQHLVFCNLDILLYISVWPVAKKVEIINLELTIKIQNMGDKRR